MRAGESGPRPPADSGDPNMVSLLSLNLLLLGFFIVLTSLTSYEDDRKRLVLESVDEAFNGRVHAERSYDDSPAGLDNLAQIEYLLGQVGDIFGSALPAIRMKWAADAPLVSFTFPADTLFAPESTELRPGRWLLLNRLVEALTDENHAVLTYELSVYHGLSGAGSADSLAARRLGVLARAMTGRGLPAERLTVGIDQELTRRVRFVLWAGSAPRRAE